MPAIPPSTPKTGLPRTSILRRRADFELTKLKGSRKAGTFLVLNWIDQPDKDRRFAVIVPKAVGNAVRRNLLKRRTREIYRRLQVELPQNLWSIWIVRRGAHEVPYEKLKDEMTRIYKRAHLLSEGTASS